jgi:pyruvate kinase
MNDTAGRRAAPDGADLGGAVAALRDAVLTEGAEILARFSAEHGALGPGVANLAHYLALRHRDIRDLQRRLMAEGLSSLGRLESRVLPTLDAVAAVLDRLDGRDPARPRPAEATFFAGERLLASETDRLFGPPQAHRRGRIMVTLPSEAAGDPALVLDLARRGMDVARINCAHDGGLAWEAMANHVRTASGIVRRGITVMMDIAGPKIRTAAVVETAPKTRLLAGDAFLLSAGAPAATDAAPVAAAVSLPGLVERLAIGDRVLYNDGKLQGIVEEVGGDEARVRVTATKAGGVRLKPEKGLNLPDTALGLAPLTAKDVGDLDSVVRIADMVGYSFVSRPGDIDLLEAAIAGLRPAGRPLGLVAKIERPEAVANLPALIARASGRRPFGVMIARGDLAAEIGFERLAEMQEEILWICEAAGVPVIWATQVLETLVRDGVPSRGEMTDAAMAARAECVMLNKGPEVGSAVDVLDRLMARMDGHLRKKTPTLRALSAW